MHFDLSRTAASLTLRARFTRCAALAIFSTTLFAVAANAVVVRGRVTDALGAPVGGAQVRLFENGQSVALAYADADGSYEIRFANAGRFALLGTGTSYLPSLSTDFYGGATDVLEKDVVLAANTVRQDVTVSATGIPTPLPQLTAPLSVLAPELFTTRLGVIDEMRQAVTDATPETAAGSVPGADRADRRRDVAVPARGQLHREPRADRRNARRRCWRHVRLRYGEFDSGRQDGAVSRTGLGDVRHRCGGERDCDRHAAWKHDEPGAELLRGRGQPAYLAQRSERWRSLAAAGLLRCDFTARYFERVAERSISCDDFGGESGLRY